MEASRGPVEFHFDPHAVRDKRVSVMLKHAVTDLIGVQLQPPEAGRLVVLVDEEGDRYNGLVETVHAAGTIDVVVDLSDRIPDGKLTLTSPGPFLEADAVVRDMGWKTPTENPEAGKLTTVG